MLNELYEAASSLASAVISPKDWHKEYVPVRAPKLAFFVYLDQNGEIADISRVDEKSEVSSLRKWESKGDLRQSFPYLNVPPLLWVRFDPKKNEDDKALEKALKAKTASPEQLRQFEVRVKSDGTTKPWEENAFNKLQSCLDKGRTLKTMLGQAPKESLAIIALTDRLDGVSARDFHAKLQRAFSDKLLNSPDIAAKYFGGLFYSGEKKPGNAVTLLLELIDGTSRFEYPVRHERVRDWINTKLISQSQDGEVRSSEVDIFGDDAAGCEQTFDDVPMRNVLGNVKLRAMVAAAKCQYRYGKAEAESCPVGQASRSKMKGALEWLVDPSREGKTWTTVSRATGNEEILLAYPSVLPPEPPNTALFFGGSSDVNTDNSGQFESCAKNVTGTLRGLMAKNPDIDIRVFVLRKIDPARRRISSNKRYSAQHLIDSAEQWRAGCHNLPRVLVKQFTNDKKAEWREPEAPFPMEVVWVLNTLWSRDGKSTNKVKNAAADDGIILLLEEGVFLQPVLYRGLYAVTRNAVGLVLALGQAHSLGQVFIAAKSYTRQAIILPSILGLLLFKMNITKEEYMKLPPYLIGRLLSLADQLHYHYCQHVRNGSVPHQLMGNALMPTALEEPIKALALYCNRILPYQAWAKTTSDEKAAGLARYFLAELGKVCSELGGVFSDTPSTNLPERCTDSDKAQMLIGYLARSEKSDSETL